MCQRVSITLEKKQAIFVGTGDIFAALMLAWMHKTDNDLKASMEKTIASLQAILDRTLNSIQGNGTSNIVLYGNSKLIILFLHYLVNSHC